MERPKKFLPVITMGNVLTIVAMVGSTLTLAFGNPGDYIRAEARITALENAAQASERRDLEFQRDVRQRLTDLGNDLREFRQSTGIKWSELPPRR